MMYKIFFKLDDNIFYLDDLSDDLRASWTLHPEIVMEFHEGIAQVLVDILQDKYPKLTLETTFFL